MPHVSSIGTHLPCWGAPEYRVPGDDEDASALAVEATAWATLTRSAVHIANIATSTVNRSIVSPRQCEEGLDSVMHHHKHDRTTSPATAQAAKQAFGTANMTRSNIEAAEVHDFFTGIELIRYEDQSFADRFDGFHIAGAEVTSVGGALPVNPVGGLKAKGHPPGATGVAQCVELFQQLRGEAVNQVDGARVALAHNVSGPTAVAAVTIPEGPDQHGR